VSGRRRHGQVAVLVAALLPPSPGGVSPSPREKAPMSAASTPVRGERATISGIRVTAGNAVDCPQIRDDAGRLHAVSYLSPRVAVGDRVTVSGTYAVTTRCLGLVLAMDREVPHDP
jgi:hypothetical protein